MIEIKVNKYVVSVQETELLVTGAVSTYKCRFTFDEFWDGFFKSAVFRVGSLVKTVVLDAENTCGLPWELLGSEYIGMPVEVSVYGAKDASEILPTIWDKLGRVRGGSEPGEDAKTFTPSLYDQMAHLVGVYSDKAAADAETASAAAQVAESAERNAENAARTAIGARDAAASALGGVREALKELPAGDTLIINDLTTGGVSAALSAEMGKVLGRRPNRNILINPCFLDPVNQRGMMEYSGIGYTIDGWKGMEKTAEIYLSNGTIQMTSQTARLISFGQQIEAFKQYAGRTVTLSVLVNGINGTVRATCRYGSSTLEQFYAVIDDVGLFSVTGKIPDDPSQLLVFFTFLNAGALLQIEAVKLELGDTQTLAHQNEDGSWVLNEIPDKAEELWRCQRYYQLFSGEAARPTALADYRPAMRTTPATGTIDIDGVTYYYADANL